MEQERTDDQNGAGEMQGTDRARSDSPERRRFERTFSVAGERVRFVLDQRAAGIPEISPHRPISLVITVFFSFSIPSVSHYFGWVGLVVALALFVYWLFLDRRNPRKSMSAHPVDAPPGEGVSDVDSARLVAKGSGQTLRLIAEIEDQIFEPIVILLEIRMSQVLIGVVVSVGLVLAAIELDLQLELAAPFCMLISGFGIWLFSRFRPTYFRVSPGRLDVMVGNAFSSRIRVIDRIDLRCSRVELGGKSRQVQIQPPGRKALRIYHDHTSEPMQFVMAVFQGAICTLPAPSLPDDALLG